MIPRSDRQMEIVAADRVDARLCIHPMAWLDAAKF
jgi:hypothetical protein